MNDRESGWARTVVEGRGPFRSSCAEQPQHKHRRDEHADAPPKPRPSVRPMLKDRAPNRLSPGSLSVARRCPLGGTIAPPLATAKGILDSADWSKAGVGMSGDANLPLPSDGDEGESRGVLTTLSKETRTERTAMAEAPDVPWRH